ncbi:MAG TPA: BrnT family toxin [Stellaceae bacterium]|nr:BrnT family toxin [Stellaceae bacterium]
MAEFEWDPEKESRNIHKHGIDFATAKLIWDGSVFERIDNRQYGETRFQAFGVVENRILTVIFTWRGEARRIISARRANVREKRLFETEIPKLGRSPPD